MPAYSSLKTFIQSLKTGETNITKTFAKALAAEGVDNISDDTCIDPHLSDWLKSALAKHGMKPEEIAHLENDWPMEKKKEVRLWIVSAVQASRSVAFSWELFAGANPSNRKDDGDPPEPVSITFQSPRKGVRLSGMNYGQVKVDR